MQWIWEQFGQQWDNDSYGELAAVEKDIRVEIKASSPELKEKQIKDLLSPKLWRDQKALLDTTKTLRDQLVQQMGEGVIASGQYDDFNQFDDELKRASKATVNGKPAVVEYLPDSDLRDYGSIPLDPSKQMEELTEDYFDRDVAPHVPDTRPA